MEFIDFLLLFCLLVFIGCAVKRNAEDWKDIIEEITTDLMEGEDD